MDYFYILIGLIGLFVGGEALVRGSASIAHRLSISPLIIGLTVVGFGTSTPELLVSVEAALQGVPDIAVGNIVGSNIANILLIVGGSALVWPMRGHRSDLRRDIAFVVCTGLVLLPLFAVAQVSRLAGLGLVVALAVYLLWTFLKPGPETSQDDTPTAIQPLAMSLAWAVFGLVALLFGARFLVDGAVSLARDFGVSEAFIGLTIVAVGTSLPELATSIVAALRRQSDIAIGNVLGSNIFNILGILGITAMITPIPVAPRFLSFDLPVMIASSILLTILLLTRPQIGRATGALMLLAYAAYVYAAQ